MSVNKSVLVAGIAIVALAAVGGGYLLNHKTTAHQDTVFLATPPGVTLQTINTGGGMYRKAGPAIYANASGKTLYTNDNDTDPTKSACVDDCAKAWPAAVAPAGAMPFGDWSVVTRGDGTKQWAFKGKPLYSFAKDEAIGDAKGNGVATIWHHVLFEPANAVTAPDGLAVQLIPDAMGQGLVDDHGMTLYTFDGEVKADKAACSGNTACINDWKPLLMPHMAHPTGDFSVAIRDDGTRQWAYKGKGLYTFNGDLTTGDANGVGVDPHRQVAMVMRNFMPAGTSIQHAPGLGTVLSVDGKTLYRREPYRYQVGGHDFRGGTRANPAYGRAVGTSGCDTECQKVWHAFKAAPDASPSGDWTIEVRGDGTKQWAYQGYALYTYDRDKNPGDAMGNNIYDVKINEDSHAPVSPVFDLLVDDGEHKPAQGANPLALWWHVVWPAG